MEIRMIRIYGLIGIYEEIDMGSDWVRKKRGIV